MKEYWASVSFTGNIKVSLKAKTKEEVANKVFDEIEGLDFLFKDGSTLQILDCEWGLLENTNRGNVSPPYLNDFEINEN